MGAVEKCTNYIRSICSSCTGTPEPKEYKVGKHNKSPKDFSGQVQINNTEKEFR